jgi:sugar/nucleoside kinase (ribokinase family)
MEGAQRVDGLRRGLGRRSATPTLRGSPGPPYHRIVYRVGEVRAEGRPKRFDVICAGEARWKVATRERPLSEHARRIGLRPGGGPVSVALTLASEGLRVGLATVLADDAFGRACLERVSASGIAVEGVSLARSHARVVRVDASGSAARPARDGDEEPPLEVPSGWSSSVLLLSGLSPVVSHAAALCKAARAARRRGTFVVIDINASLYVWAGRDARTIRMVLREVDAARCSLADLAVVGTDVAAVRGALRPGAALIVGDETGRAVATGPFGEVTFVPPPGTRPVAAGAGDACTAALCAELARPGEPGESASARWFRALQQGYEKVRLGA